MFKSLFLPLILVAAFIVFVGLLSQGKLNPVLNKIAVVPSTTQKTIKIDTTEIQVEIAKTNDEKAKGLSNRTSLDEKSGMVFVFNQNSTATFWMKDTKIPLDFIWVNDDKIVGIEKNVPIQPGVDDSQLKRYQSPSVIDYVIEVNAGFSDKYNIKVGQSLYGLEQL